MACQNQQTGVSKVTIKNNSNSSLSDVLVKIDLSKLQPKIDLSEPDNIVVLDGSLIPFQLIEKNND